MPCKTINTHLRIQPYKAIREADELKAKSMSQEREKLRTMQGPLGKNPHEIFSTLFICFSSHAQPFLEKFDE